MQNVDRVVSYTLRFRELMHRRLVLNTFISRDFELFLMLSRSSTMSDMRIKRR